MVEPINNSKTLAIKASYATANGQPRERLSSTNEAGNDLPVRKEEAVQSGQQNVQEPSVEQYESVVKEITQYVQNLKRELQFSVNNDTGETIIHVVNPETGELVRTLPLDEAVSLAEQLKSGGGGSLLNVRA